MANFQRILNLLFVYVIFLVLLAGYLYQYLEKSEPCYLCLLQRIGLIGIAAALLMNLRFGIRMQHYGLAILSALLGRAFALRQIAMHVCPQFPTFGHTVFGLDLYIWTFIVFSCSIFAEAILAIFYGYTKNKTFVPKWNGPERSAFWAIILITAGNCVSTLLECGLSSCFKN